MSTLVSNNIKHPSSGTNNIVLNSDGSATIAGASITLSTSVASTSGTSIDFTNIPSWVKRISVIFDEVSTNGASIVQVQLGDSGGVETTGYYSAGAFISYDGIATVSSSVGGFASGFIIFAGTADVDRTGIMVIENINGNKWVSSHSMGGFFPSTTALAYHGGGRKELSATLDRIRITTVNGTDTFDAGTINISYEG